AELADQSGGVERRAARQIRTLDEHDVVEAELREPIGNRATADPATDDDHTCLRPHAANLSRYARRYFIRGFNPDGWAGDAGTSSLAGIASDALALRSLTSHAPRRTTAPRLIPPSEGGLHGGAGGGQECRGRRGRHRATPQAGLRPGAVPVDGRIPELR